MESPCGVPLWRFHWRAPLGGSSGAGRVTFLSIVAGSTKKADIGPDILAAILPVYDPVKFESFPWNVLPFAPASDTAIPCLLNKRGAEKFLIARLPLTRFLFVSLPVHFQTFYVVPELPSPLNPSILLDTKLPELAGEDTLLPAPLRPLFESGVVHVPGLGLGIYLREST